MVNAQQWRRTPFGSTDRIIALYGKCTTDELERIVNNMIDNAIVEINEDRSVSYAVQGFGMERCCIGQCDCK